MTSTLRRPLTAATLLALSALLAVTPSVVGQFARDSAVDKRRPELTAPDIGAALAEVRLDSGYIANATDGRAVIWSEVIESPGATWVRLTFDEATLGAAPAGGQFTELRLTSLYDGAIQTMNALHLRQWRWTSAFFNGDAVRVEIIADARAAPSRVLVNRVIIGAAAAREKSICGATDDRQLSNDPRAARVVPVGCTAWLIDGTNHYGRPGSLLSAGHCFTGSLTQVVQFNVPLSGPTGAVLHPPPSDQYAIDLDSLQHTPGPNLGDDWAYFGCFPNSTTGLTPLLAQGDAFTLADIVPRAVRQDVRVTGYGVTSAPVPPAWNQAQKSHLGPLVAEPGTVLVYRVDTTAGNSGSGIETTGGGAVGIHTSGGCDDEMPDSSNYGTAIDNLALQRALHRPLGICWPCDGVDSDGDAVINVADLLGLLASWGLCAEACLVDSNFDGQANVADLLDLLGLWGECPPGNVGPLVAMPPVHDFCDDAIPVSAGVIEFDTTWATGFTPSHFECGSGNDLGRTVNDVWYAFTAPADGLLDLSTCGTASYDTDLVLYTGTCAGLQLLACNDDAAGEACGGSPLFQSHIADVPVMGGRRYLIRVGGWYDVATDNGPGLLTVTFLP